MNMDKVDDFISAWLLIDHETGKVNRYVLMFCLALIFGIYCYFLGVSHQNQYIMGKIDKVEERMLEKTLNPESTAKPSDPLSI